MSYWGSASTGGKEHEVSGAHEDEAGRRCAIGFNPGEHQATDKIKGFCATAMKAVTDERDKLRRPEMSEKTDVREIEAYNDAHRCFATALTHLQFASMMGVSGLHTRKNIGLG